MSDVSKIQVYTFTDMISEQPLPVQIRVLMHLTTSYHFIRSVCSTFMLWLLPSLTPKPPMYQPSEESIMRFKERRSSVSTENTLITEDANCTCIHGKNARSKKHRVVSIPFAVPMNIATDKVTITKKARRMTMPARQFSKSCVKTLKKPFPSIHMPIKFTPSQTQCSDTCVPPSPTTEVPMTKTHSQRPAWLERTESQGMKRVATKIEKILHISRKDQEIIVAQNETYIS